MNDELVFAPEVEENKSKLDPAFKVMIIDDDEEVHAFTKLALKSFKYKNRKIDFISAYSEEEARRILPLHNDIAIILLDVVMETSSSGLDVAKFIRQELHNDMSRIIIRTGQPGEAPERYVIDNYDINDYKEKTELTTDKLYTTIRTALVQYTQLLELLNKKDEIYNLLVTDKLTSLANRVQLNYDLDSTKPQTLMLIDIDNFSLLNNVYGFSFGDNILLHMSEILLNVLRVDMKLYRLESDLFAILVQSTDKDLLEDEVAAVKELLDKSPFELDDLSLYIKVSIGIVNYQLGNIIQKAELALRKARKISHNRVEYYDESRDYLSFIEENNSWTARISYALNNDDILVYFQPIIECATATIVKYEALVRLRYKGEIFAPLEFLHTVRYAGYLYQITQKVFELSCQKFQDNDLVFLAWKKQDETYDKVFLWVTILAIPVTLYTAALLAQCTARELWQMPAESAQMILAATLSGSAAMILLGGSKLTYEAKQTLGVVLGLSALMAFIIYMSEYVFGPMKAEEIAFTLEYIKGDGPYTVMFWLGQWMTFILPMVLIVLSRSSKSEAILKLAALLALVGLFMVKHVWLIIPQLLPMS
ncbi:diguanylate cyclase [Sulfurimonas sp. SAG-AH-194-L11]|nr:diguanylate cyclase [Sulfurimonas sp. SAG-AH-194-L11]MDF1877869.1 diguanylate cyclase [Sulfurimonas sp. SAG-AH-194-L11]